MVLTIARMVVELWTDIVCPWCYIGVNRFERALERFPDVEVRVRPFQLDPEAPIPGIPARERYAQRFGDEAETILERVTAAATADGLPIDFDRALSANTFDAHRLIAFASQSGKARDVEHRLYSAYFAEGLDVSDRNVLIDIARASGLDAQSVAAHLAGDDGVDEVRRGFMEAFERGITGVPAFVFNDEFLVPGAVDEATFTKIIAQMQAMEAQ